MMDNLLSFTGGMVENGIFVFVLPTRNIENEKEED